MKYVFVLTVVLCCAGPAPAQKPSPLAKYQRVGGAKKATAKEVQQTYRKLEPIVGALPVAAVRPTLRSITATAKRIDPKLSTDKTDSVGKSFYSVGRDKLVVNLSLEYEGVPFSSKSSKMVLMTKEQKPLVARDRNVPKVLPTSVTPTVQANLAVRVALRDAKLQAAESSQRLPRDIRFTNTKPVTEIYVNEAGKGVLCWSFLVRARDTRLPFSVQYWISAQGQPKVVAIDDLIYTAHNGQVLGSVKLGGPFDEVTHETPLPNVMVTRISEGDMVHSNADGTFSFPDGDVQGRDLVATALFGPQCVIFSDEGAELRTEATPLPSENAVMEFRTNDEFEVAQLTAFYWTNRAHAFTQEKVGNRLAFVPTRVNLNQSGNAFWDGFALNFFKSGDGFPNTAYSDIVLHEYGHAVDGRLGGIQDPAYSEGFGDALAILVTKQPVVGRNFFGEGNDNDLRDAREVVAWDPDLAQDNPHEGGRAYSGFAWQLLKELMEDGMPQANAFAVTKQLVLDAAEMNPSDIPDAVKLSFLADDDDGDITNGSPHFEQLAKAADSRQIPRPQLVAPVP